MVCDELRSIEIVRLLGNLESFDFVIISTKKPKGVAKRVSFSWLLASRIEKIPNSFAFTQNLLQ